MMNSDWESTGHVLHAQSLNKAWLDVNGLLNHFEDILLHPLMHFDASLGLSTYHFKVCI